MLRLRELLRRLFGAEKGEKEKGESVEHNCAENGVLVVKTVEERILEDLIQDENILDALRKTKACEIYLSNFRSYYKLLQYQYAEFLEKRRRERGATDFYIS